MLKRMLNIILSLLIFANLSIISVSANGNAQIIVSSATIEKGTSNVDITISLKNNPGIVSAKFTVDFDSDVLTLTNVSDTGALGTTNHSPSFDSPYNLYWNNGTVKDNFVIDENVVILSFSINESASIGVYPISISYDEDNIIDVDLNSMDFECVDGFIEILQEKHDSTSSSNSHTSNNNHHYNTNDKNVIDNKKAETETIDDNSKNQIILTINETTMLVFGKEVKNDVSPLIVNDRTMLPIRFVAENLGAIVNWLDKERKVEIVNSTSVINIYIDNEYATINNTPILLDSPAFIKNDRTFLPVRFVSEALGAIVNWDEKNQKVTITKQEK